MIFLLSCFLVTSPLLAAVRSREVSYKSGDATVHGILYLPDGAGAHPAIVVIHEWWGLVPWVKDQAAELAAQGYVTLAVDLYRGQSTTDPKVAMGLMRGLPPERGVRDLLAAVHYLTGLKAVDAKRMGAVGWCMGGGYAARLAVADPNLKAVAINYGELPTDRASLEKIHAAVLGNFGGQDRVVTPQEADAFTQALRGMGKQVDIKFYPDAGHAFENPNNKTGYRAADARDAHTRMREFFHKYLQE
ncbi:MAG TPA: dienelactone hydrolase family protein [Acidobacteriaceae bacterium]|nr:dienelactone hydrolase family protein [Acidobacteriaceae bacterium]